jgi:hypothetical protein
MVESTSVTVYPARRSGVEIASKLKGAVASWLENAGKKSTTFRETLRRLIIFHRKL